MPRVGAIWASASSTEVDSGYSKTSARRTKTAAARTTLSTVSAGMELVNRKDGSAVSRATAQTWTSARTIHVDVLATFAS